MDYVLDYINESYDLTVDGLISYQIFDKIHNRNINGISMTTDVKRIFNLTKDEFSIVYDKWFFNKMARLNNVLVDYQIEIYNKTGVLMRISPQMLNGSN